MKTVNKRKLTSNLNSKTFILNHLHKKVVVIGGSNIDIKGSPFVKLKEKTSNPGAVTMTLGGVGRNISHNLGLMGIPVIFLSVVGEDDWGRKILEDTGKIGVNIGQVKISKKNATGKYLAILDKQGEMQVAISGMKVCEEITVGYIKSKEKTIRESDIVVVDTNLPEKTIRFVAKICSEENIKLVVEPVSVEKSKKLKSILDKIDYITPNQEELKAMTGDSELKNDEDLLKAVENLRNKGKGVKNIILTLGQRGVFLYGEEIYAGVENAGGYKFKNHKLQGKYIQPYKVETIEVTGVGDALVAGLVYGIFKGCSLEMAVRYGLAAAALTISTPDTVNPGMKEEILKVLVEHNRNLLGINKSKKRQKMSSQ